MKMFDVIGEGETGKTVVDFLKGIPKHFDPIFKRGYSNPADEIAARSAKAVNKDAADAAAKADALRQRAAMLDKEASTLKGSKGEVHPTLTTNTIRKVKGKNVEKVEPADKISLQRDANLLRQNADELTARNPGVEVPAPDKYTGGQQINRAVTGTGIGVGTGVGVFADDPEQTFQDIKSVTKSAVQGIPAILPFGGNDDDADDADDIPAPPKNESADFSDILKLAGLRSITERDHIVGIVKPKEIVALHESKQIDECGMMPSTPNQTASLSINATAGNGQEVANMLAAIMNLAGVKPVSGDMLGTSAMPPMPIVKAIDIISRGDSDSMNGHHGHDHEGEEPLTGMEEDYANTPENPTAVPKLDTNKFAYQPNAVDVGDRMDGTMPKGFPQVTKESLLQAYTQFKNGQ